MMKRAADVPPRHVLLVDDEPEFLQELGPYLRARGWIATTAPTPREALLQLETHTDIAVVVTDVRIADRDGLELAHRILQERTGPTAVAVVVVTGHGDLLGRNTTAAQMELPILCKPLVMGDFMKALDAAICRARAAAAHQPAAASERPTDHSQAEPRI